MNGCTTCGGFGDRHDPVAHGDVFTPTVNAEDALAYLARLWLRNQTAAEHIFTRWLGDDDCGTYWPEIADECREELDKLRGAVNTDDLPVVHPDETARAVKRTREYIRARYGDGPIPAFYEHGAVLFTEDDNEETA